MMNLLESGEVVYGFSTRLGQFDHSPVADFEAELLKDHLVGNRFNLPGSFLRLVAAVKLAQLSCGGSAISPELYNVIRGFVVRGDDRPASGAWVDSYGAADVVPGAWWLRTVLQDAQADLQRGDFIAAASGSFFSTAVAIVAVSELDVFLASYMSFMPPVDHRLWRESRSSRESRVQRLMEGGSDRRHTQLPISARDCSPFVSAAMAASDGVLTGIHRRINEVSANPLISTRDVPSVLSQNSFLDFELSAALVKAREFVFVALQHLQRIAERSFAEDAKPANVQRPKVVQAVVERAHLLMGTISYSSAQSGGVEDMYDMSLSASMHLILLTRLGNRIVALLNQWQPPFRQTNDLLNALALDGESSVDAELLHTWSEQLLAGWIGLADT